GAQPAVQTAPPSAAEGWPLARCTSASPCPAPWGSSEVFETCLKILVHGVVRENFYAASSGVTIGCGRVTSAFGRCTNRYIVIACNGLRNTGTAHCIHCINICSGLTV